MTVKEDDDYDTWSDLTNREALLDIVTEDLTPEEIASYFDMIEAMEIDNYQERGRK